MVIIVIGEQIDGKNKREFCLHLQVSAFIVATLEPRKLPCIKFLNEYEAFPVAIP
jgi:hypothetical protein